MKQITTLIILVIAAAGVYWFFTQPGTDIEQAETTQPAEGVTPVVPTQSGTLIDVTEGKTVRGILTGGTAEGTVSAGFSVDQYSLEAVFNNLPEPQGTDFYEGWVVRRGISSSIISTGRAVQEDGGTYSNVFTSSDDLTEYDFYVLTLEPDDGDPAPADHILEGELQ
jgi:hypothetical protein